MEAVDKPVRLRRGRPSRGTSRAAGPAAFLGNIRELVERVGDGRPEQPRGLVGTLLRTALGLGHDPVDHAELEAVGCIRLERRGGLARLAGVAPEDRRAALRRDDRVDGVLLHQHAVGERDRDGAPGSALADDAGDGRHLEPRHHRLRPRDRTALAVLLGRDAGVGAGRVHERDERETVALGERHHAHRLPVALRIRHAEVAFRPLLQVAALLVADHRHRPVLELAEPAHERRVVAAPAVAV